MSVNITDRKRENRLSHTLRGLGQTQTTRRAMQPQGSQALEVQTVWGYVVLNVPPDASTIATHSIDIEATDPRRIVIATVTHSTFMKYTNGTLINADLESHGVGDDVYRIWLNYDGRPDMSQYWLIPTSDPRSIDQIMLDTAGSASIPDHKARITFSAFRLNDTPTPGNLDKYLIFFQARLIVG